MYMCVGVHVHIPKLQDHSLVDGDDCGNLGPEAGVLYGCDCLLRVTVDVHV